MQWVVLFVKAADNRVHYKSSVHVFLLKVGWGGVHFLTYAILLEG